jgi:hypothetical protein
MNLRLLRPFDIAAICLAVAVTVIASVAAYGGSAVPSGLRVESQDGTYLYDLGQDAQLIFAGPIGETAVEIVDGLARVVSSPCREQICVNSGLLETTGDWTACLPNRVFLEITGNEDSDVDAVSF